MGSIVRFLYVCMVNTIYLLSFAETPRKFIIAIINLRGVSTKLNKSIVALLNQPASSNFVMVIINDINNFRRVIKNEM